MNDILIIDNDREAYRLVTLALGPNYSYQSATTIEQSHELLAAHPFAAITLEIDVDSEKSFNLFQKLKQFSLNQDTPIIIISKNLSISDKVHAFSLGADDYVTKPYEPLELRARVEARIAKRFKKSNTLKIDELTLESHFQRVFKIKNGAQVDLQLTPIEFKILYSLIESKGRPLSRESLVALVWDKEHSFESRGIDAHVSNLRKKLGSHSKIVGSVYGVGYVYRPMLNKTPSASSSF